MTIGAGNNIEEASKIEYKKDLAVINCCENEFGIATATTAGANPLNPISQYYKIIEAKKSKEILLNCIRCESHRERFVDYLLNK